MVKEYQANISEYSKEEKKELQKWFKENENKIFFPKKYFSAQKDYVLSETKKLYAIKPSVPIRQVIIEILSTLPDFLPGDNLVKVTKYIVKTWEKEQSRKAEAA